MTGFILIETSKADAIKDFFVQPFFLILKVLNLSKDNFVNKLSFIALANKSRLILMIL